MLGVVNRERYSPTVVLQTCENAVTCSTCRIYGVLVTKCSTGTRFSILAILAILGSMCHFARQSDEAAGAESCSSCGVQQARYYCAICKLWEDERSIYHCQYCNLCRVGSGLGVDSFHCMRCNSCIYIKNSSHVCRDVASCPVCTEHLFDSCQPYRVQTLAPLGAAPTFNFFLVYFLFF